MRYTFFFGLVCFFLILSASALSAGEELVLEKFFFSGDQFPVDGVFHKVTIASTADKVLIEAEGMYLWLDLGECDTDKRMRVCFNDVEYDEDLEKYKAKLRITSLSPSVSVSQTASSSSPGLGDEVDISVTISNTGAIAAESLVYELALPDGLAVADMGSGVDSQDGAVLIRADIDADEEEAFAFTLKAVDDSDEQLQAEISYFDGFTTETIYSNALDIKVSNPYDVELSTNTSTKTVYVGDHVEITASVDNTAATDVDLTGMVLSIPETLKIISYDEDWDKDGQSLKYAGTLRSNSSVELNVVVQPKYKTASTLALDAALEDEDMSVALDRTLKLSSSLRKTIIRPYFVQGDTVILLEDDVKLEGGQKGQFEVYVDNPYSGDQILDVKVLVGTEEGFLTMQSDMIKNIAADGAKKVIDSTIVTPSLSSSKKYALTYNISYETEFGYSHSEEIERDLSIVPVDDLVVKHSFSDSSPESGQQVKVTVTLKNNRETDLEDITVADSLPSSVDVKGTTQTKLDLSQGDTATLYEYYLDLPVVAEETEIEIISKVTYADGSKTYDFIVSDTFDVDPRDPTVNLNRLPDSKDVVIGEIIPIDYEVENKEDYRIDDIVFDFPGQENTYLIDAISYYLKRLNPGQERTLDDIEKRLIFVHDDSSTSAGRASFSFTDDQGTRHTQEDGPLSFSTEEADMTLPLLNIYKEIDSVSTRDMSYTYTIRIENIGDISAQDVLLFDAGEEYVVSVAAGTNYSRNFTRALPDDYLVASSHLSFDAGSHTYYALSEGTIDLLDESRELASYLKDLESGTGDEDSHDEAVEDDAELEDEASQDDASSVEKDDGLIENSSNRGSGDAAADGGEPARDDKGDTSPDDGEQKPGFFQRILNLFKWLFGGDKEETP